MTRKLEVTGKLEGLGDLLGRDDFVAMLNLPGANFCEKRAELVQLQDGGLEQACKGCVTQPIKGSERLSLAEIKRVIDYFADNYGTRFITINGRGDPFHPRLKAETLEKISYAASRGMQAYIFTAGNNLDEDTCVALAQYGVNVMISLFGNRFIDAAFFDGKSYAVPRRLPQGRGKLQDEHTIAQNLRRLINAYEQSENQPQEGMTRIGMNYVVSESDIADDGAKVRALQAAANRNGIFFVCNTNFLPHADKETQRQMEAIAHTYSDFNIRHTTAVDGQCQMGAGSSATVDYDGELFRCPYMSGKGEGKFHRLTDPLRQEVIAGYLHDRAYACVMRKTPIQRES